MRSDNLYLLENSLDGSELELTPEEKAIFQDQPIPNELLVFYLRSWDDLSTEKGMGAIPWSKIVQHGQYHGLEDDLLDLHIAAIKAIDRKLSAYEKEKEGG